MKNLKFNLKSLPILTVFLLTLSSAFAADYETDDLAKVYNEIDSKIKEFGKKRVLAVFDIDNTLLVINQDLGSDQWFAWQSRKIKEGDFTNTVAKSFDSLLKVQEKLYALSGTHPTQNDAALIIKKLQSKGVAVIALTARGHDYRNSTQRELAKNDISFKPSAIGVNAGFAGKYIPYSLFNLEGSGLTKEEAVSWRLGKGRNVSYGDGVFMLAGQHKGAMLRTLLYKTREKFDAIIFVDDKAKNTTHMTQGFEKTNIFLTTFRYTKEDANVASFNSSAKKRAIQDWKELSSVLGKVFTD